MVDTRSTIWLDAQGRTRQTITRGIDSLTGGPTLAAVQADVAFLSNADWMTNWQGTENTQTPAPPGAQYVAVGDYAELVFTAADGSSLYLTIPAPISTLFLADGETVDITQITTLISDVTGCLVTRTGLHPINYVGGVRRAKLKEYQ